MTRSLLRALIAALLVVSPALSAPAGTPEEKPARWLRAGDLREMSVYKAGREYYLTIETLARMSDAQARWQQAASQVCLTNSSGELCFDWDSRAVSRNDRRLRGTVPLRFENETLFVPMSFAISPEFESFSATNLSWQADRLQMTQEPEVNLRIPQVERVGGIYRLSFDLNRKSQPQLLEKSARRIWLRFGRAVSDGSQVLEGDTVISQVRVNQKRHSVELMLDLGADAERSDVHFEENKRRLIIEVTPSARALAALPGATAGPAPAAPAPEPRVASRPLSIPEKAPAPAPSAPKVDAPVAATPKARALTSARGQAPSGTRTYVIDAGHGGVDSGAIGVRGTAEKDINLAVARNLARELKKVKGVRVIMTRDRDDFIALSQRTAIANAANADLFVSIHCNSALSSKSVGFETYFLSPDATDKAAAAVARLENSVVSLEAQKGSDSSKLGQLLASMAIYNFVNQSSKFAALICRNVRDRSNVDRATVKEADFYVLRGAQMPAVLVELEYLSNPITEARLRSSRYQNQLVKGIVQGVLAYDRLHRQEQSAYVSQPGRNPGRADR